MAMNGPPTPPATSAIEIQDAESQVATAPDVEQPPAVPPSVDQSQFDDEEERNPCKPIVPVLVLLAERDDFQGLVTQAELTDLDAGHDQDDSHLVLTTLLILAYLILNDLPPARFAFIRLPGNLSATPVAQAVFELLASTWQRKYANIYPRAEALVQIVNQADFLDERLTAVITGMIVAFVASFRQRTYELIAKTYSSLPLQLAQTYLGLPANELLPVVERLQWSYDAASQLLYPRSIASMPSRPERPTPGPSTIATFHLVAESVVKLEA